MATRTSVASGNFSSVGTWDTGVPVNGDTFIIASGHTVAVDAGISIPADGYGDSEIRGILQHAASGTSTIRMNGTVRVYSGGTYHMRGDAVLEFKGTTGDAHGLVIQGENAANFIAEGEDGMPSTTLLTGISEGATSLSFADASNFGVGDWIAIFNNTTTQTAEAQATTLRDEGFWIHEISGNTVYFRQYVGPESTVVSGENNIIYVGNGKIFRVGQKVIFGTGVNRNIHTITAINYGANELTLDGDVVGVVADLPIYETGTDKIHGVNSKIRKVATVTTLASTDTDTTITVANASKFTAGDEIWIEQRSAVGGTSDRTYNAYGRDSSILTVSSVSGNTIVLTTAIGYNVPAGILVTRLTRRVQVRTVTDSDYGYVQDIHYSSNYNKKRIIKDVYFRRMGISSSSNYRGVWLRSYCSTDSLPITLTEQVPALSRAAWMEGATLRHSGSTLDWSGLMVHSARNQKTRCCFVCNSKDGLGITGNENGGVYNCISANSDRWCCRVESNYYYWEYAYNYHSRGNSGIARYIPSFNNGNGCHHNIHDAANSYAFYQYNNQIGMHYFKCKFTGYRYGIVTERAFTHAQYCYFEPVPAYSIATLNRTEQAGGSWVQIDQGQLTYATFISVEHNFEFDAISQYTYDSERSWDNNENSWRVYNRNTTNYGVGWFECVYIPANVTFRARQQIKLAPGYSGNYPRFEARDVQSQRGPNQMGNSGGYWSSPFAGGNAVIQFNASAEYEYQTRELTIGPVNFPRYIQVGVHVDSSNASEGYWMKETEIYLDKPYSTPSLSSLNAGPGPRYYTGLGIRNTFDQLITRLGGRLN